MSGTVSRTRTRTAVAMAAAVWLAWTCASPAFAAQRVALVIGNASYEHVPALANPLNDATDMGAALGRLGFDVTRLENAGYAALRRGLLEFQRAASASEVAVVFYAGHGIEVDQRNFLVPVDARLASDQDVEFEAVPLELVSRSVERASGLRLVILDACRENPFAVKMQRAGATRSIGRGLARVEPSGETLVAYAAKEGTVAADGAGRNSPFSEALLGHLEEPGLEVGLMFRRVRDAVLASTGGRQEPFTYGSLSSRGVYLTAPPSPAPSLASSSAPAPAPAIVPEAARVTAEQLAAQRVYWESVKGSTDPAELRGYLERYPGGTFEVLARSRLKRLEGGSAVPEPSATAAATTPDSSASSASARVEAEREFWALVKESDVAGDLEAYLEYYPDGAYVPLARIRLMQLQRERPATQAAASPTAEPSPESPPDAPAPAASPELAPTPQEVETSLGLERTERRRVQQGLASLGYAPGPADGLFGARTREAIRRYQGEKGFEATGYLRGEEAQALVALGEEAARAEAEGRRADDAAFAGARAQGTVEAYGSYLAGYPSGRHVAQARRLRTEAERRERASREKAPGRRFRDCAECPELVVVPSGTYRMGSPSGEEGRYDDEGPVHRVRIAEPFAVGVYEVTRGEFGRFVRETGHSLGDTCWTYEGGEWKVRSGRSWRNPGFGQTDAHPVACVNWEDARGYVRWLSRETGEGYRLLSESEWEYVARAGTVTPYWWGDAVGRGRANCDGCGSRWDDRQTAPVGSFTANAFGVHDVHGNVWERVEDCWHGGYAGAPGDGRAWTSGGICSARVVRGGSWYYSPRDLRSAYRFRFPAGNRSSNVGFRVARTLD